MDITSLVATPAGAGVLVGVATNLAGWLENAMKDGKIDKYEIGKLGATVMKVLILTLMIYYGLDVSSVEAAGLAGAFKVGMSEYGKKING